MTLSEFTDRAVSDLNGIYPLPEARGMVSMLTGSLLGVPRYSHITEPGMEISPEALEAVRSAMDRLLRHEPVQYVLGRCEFCGRSFKVSPGVLIPRPETEELVSYAAAMASEGARILDLCTGSGCIAWSLLLDLPGSEVTAVDVSEEALRIAKSQFEGPSPRFVKADVLDHSGMDALFAGENFDLLVSNPPYIMEKEKAEMRRNVLDYEPGMALFVPDGDPLLFYRAIAGFSAARNIPQGIVEINERLPEKTAQTFKDAGYAKVEILCDIASKPRFVKFA